LKVELNSEHTDLFYFDFWGLFVGFLSSFFVLLSFISLSLSLSLSLSFLLPKKQTRKQQYAPFCNLSLGAIVLSS